MAKPVPSEGLSASASRGPRLAAPAGLSFAALWRKLVARFGNSYRPEQHYMRGPGPKWRERNSTDLNDDGPGANARQQLGVLNG